MWVRDKLYTQSKGQRELVKKIPKSLKFEGISFGRSGEKGVVVQAKQKGLL